MTAAAKPILEPSASTSIAGWAEADHAGALAAFRRSCAEILDEGRAFQRPVELWRHARGLARASADGGAATASRAAFFEDELHAARA